MDSLKKGFSFLKQSWQMAAADRDLIKPTIYAMITGIIVTIIGLIPIALVQIVIGGSQFGQIITYILGALLVFVQFTVTYIFSAMTIHLIYSYLSDGDGRMDHAWAIVRRDFLDILSLAVVSTLVNLLLSILRGQGKSRGRNFIANLVNTLWTQATYLILPAMVVEDINLKGGLERTRDIVKNNLLLVGVSTVGVRWVTGLIGFLLGGTGIMLGFGVGFGLVSLAGTNAFGLITGISLSALLH